MHHQEGKFQSIDELPLYYQAWLPDTPKAVVQIIHGFGEHSGRYQNVVDKLVALGYAIYAHDLRGHGKSGGIRTHIDNFNQYVDDAKCFFDLIRDNHLNLPIFLLGHSMGSFIAPHFVKKYESLFQGLILSGTGSFPSGIFTESILKRVRGVSRLISRFLPPLRLAVPLAGTLSTDSAVGETYARDPLVVKTITLQLALEMVLPVLEIKNFIGQSTLPLLIQCGSKDLIVTGIQLIAKRLKMDDQTVRIYEGLMHEVYNEREGKREIVLNDLADWLERHV
jgi:alpha-beta hydrolase superfamily lysophospholipase